MGIEERYRKWIINFIIIHSVAFANLESNKTGHSHCNMVVSCFLVDTFSAQMWSCSNVCHKYHAKLDSYKLYECVWTINYSKIMNMGRLG